MTAQSYQRFTPDADVKLEPSIWCQLYDVHILDPDGWRGANHKRWTVEITLEEFIERVNQSTAKGHENLPILVREKNMALNEDRPSTTKEYIMAETQTTTNTESAEKVEKVKVSFRDRAHNFSAKHPRVRKAGVLIAAAATGFVGHKVLNERAVVKKEDLPTLALDADGSVTSVHATPPSQEA